MNIKHFHYVLSMGAVFAMFSGWYHWIPKMLGLNYNPTLAKIQFWLLFIGVKIKGSLFEIGKRLYSGFSNRGSPFNPEEFAIFFLIWRKKKEIYIEN